MNMNEWPFTKQWEKINITSETLDNKVLYFNENDVPVFQCPEGEKLVTSLHFVTNRLGISVFVSDQVILNQIQISTSYSNWSNFKYQLRFESKVRLQPKNWSSSYLKYCGCHCYSLLLYSFVDTIEEFFLLQILECSYHFIHRLWKSVNENHSVSIEPCIVTSGDWRRCVCCCCCFSQCQCLLLYW